MSSPSTTHTLDKKLQSKLAELQGKMHVPAEMASLVFLVTQLQNKYLPRVIFNKGKESLPPETLSGLSPRDKRFAGLPILQGPFPLDLPLADELARELLAALPEAVPQMAACAHDLTEELRADPALFEAACSELLDASPSATVPSVFAGWEKKHPDAPRFFHFVVTSAVMPSLLVVGRLLGEEHDTEKVWPHGHCPVCGKQPLIGRLADKEGKRFHSCSFCGFEYRAPRVGCPFCLAPESEGAEYHVAEDEPGYLLTVCKSCKSYFKLGDFREYDRAWFPLLDDLSSIVLDLHALQMDYKRPTLSGWGF